MTRHLACCLLCLPPSLAHGGGGDFERGLAYADKKDYDKAIACFTAAIRDNPKYAKAYNNRGNAHLAKEEYGKAVEDYSEAIRLEPKEALPYYGRGLAYARRKEYGQAVRDFTAVIRLHPNEVLPHYCRGLTYYHKGEYGKAIEDYSEAIRLEPKFAPAYNNLAWLLATCPKGEVRDGKRAVTYAKKACELTGWKEADKLATLAAAQAEAGQFKEAVRWQKKALEIRYEDKNFKEQARKRLKLYEAGRPYRDE